MPSNVTMYNLLISCPGDIQAELDIIQEAVEQFNQQFSATLGIAIQTKHWSKSAYSQSGAKPQALLNKQIVDECDAAVALFWTRFGTPTDKYQSGAEEEIELMLAAGKQVFMYFCEKPIDPKKIDMNQYNKVQTFRDAYKDRGLYYTYSDDEAFRKMFFAHLTMHFMTVGKAPQAIKDDKKSILKLKSAIGSEIRDLAIIQDFALGKIPNRDDRIKEIRKCYDEALGCSVTHHSANGLFAGYNMNTFNKKIELSDSQKNMLSEIASQLEIKITDELFDLGELAENTIASAVAMIGGGRQLNGTSDEKKKYRAILRIQELVQDLIAYCTVYDCYGKLKGISFVLENSGSNVDEDIDVELIFPKEFLRIPSNLPVPKDRTFEDFIDDISMEDLYYISSTENYLDYDSSKHRELFQPRTPIKPDYMLGRGRDYEEEYREELDNIFSDYKIFEKDEVYIVQLHIDYIKHHTRIAFPTMLFVSEDNAPESISFRISSKGHSEISEDIIEVVTS